MKNTDTYEMPRHPIRVAAERAGLTTEVLRAWERRYQVVVPSRDEAGQRAYSDADIERLSMLAKLSHSGRPVGSLAILSRSDLERLLSEDAAHEASLPSPVAGHLERTLHAARSLDGASVFASLRRAVLSLGTPDFLESVVVPAIAELGAEWHIGRIGIAREHTASAAIEQMLSWVIREFGSEAGAPRLLLATPTGERHALGSLIAGALAAHEEWHVTWLGADLPSEQIAAAADRDGSHVVAVGVIATDDRDPPRAAIEALRAALPMRTPLLIGGSGADSMNGIDGVTIVRDLEHWRALLARYAPPSHG